MYKTCICQCNQTSSLGQKILNNSIIMIFYFKTDCLIREERIYGIFLATLVILKNVQSCVFCIVKVLTYKCHIFHNEMGHFVFQLNVGILDRSIRKISSYIQHNVVSLLENLVFYHIYSI